MNIDELATSDIEFHEALKGYMDARRYSLDALLRAIEDVVLELRTKKEVSAAKLQPIKKEKMRGWLYIKEKNKPRRLPRDWRDVIKIAYALELPLKNVNHLLSAAKKPSLQQLKKQVTSEDELALVSRWKIALVNLPPKSDYMVGRADHIKKATRFLRSNLPKVMNIYGPSGRGKSHLIRHLLDAEKANTADELNRFTQGIIWLYGHKKPEDLIQAFEELHIRYPPSLEKSNHRQIQFYLETKDLLIIFDDVESFEQLKDYFPNNLQAKLILISESPLDMPIKSMPLDLPAFSMNGEDAINLFDQYKKNSNWKNKHQAHLIQLSALLGQTPKHIDEYAQQFARNASILPEDIVQQLKNNPHQTHAEIFDPFFASDQTVLEKYKLLSDVQKRFARGICWMPTNSFTLEAAAAFAPFGEVKSHYLKPLENNKLILSIEPERKQKNLPTKWEFQPNIQFSLRRLSPANEANEAKVKIADYYLNFAVRNSENFKHLEMEQKGIRLILEQMLNQDELEAFTKGFTAMSRYWLSSGFFQDGLSLSDAFINKLFPLPEDDSTLNQPFDQIQAASYIEFERDFLEVYMSFISLSYQMDGTQGIRSHLNNLEKIIDVIKYPVLRARFLNNKATILRHDLSREEVKSLMLESLEICLGNSINWLSHLLYSNLAAAEYEEGNYDKFDDYLTKGLAIPMPEDEQKWIYFIYILLADGQKSLDEGKFQQATLSFNQAKSIAEVCEHDSLFAMASARLAEAALLENDLRTASFLLSGFTKYIESTQTEDLDVLFYESVKARILSAQNNYDQAEEIFLRLINKADHCGNKFESLYNKLFLGELYQKQNLLDLTQKTWQQALKTALGNSEMRFVLLASHFEYRLGKLLEEDGVLLIENAIQTYRKFNFRELAEAEQTLTKLQK